MLDNSGPAAHAVAVSPSDSADLTYTTRGLFVGTGGNIVVIMLANKAAGTTTTFTGVGDSTVLPIQVSRVLSTSTTASNIVALW